MDLEIWHSQLVHLSYRNLIANIKKVMGMEKVQGSILTRLCGSYMASHQELEISQTPMLKALEFLQKLCVDMERSLLVIFSDF